MPFINKIFSGFSLKTIDILTMEKFLQIYWTGVATFKKVLF